VISLKTYSNKLENLEKWTNVGKVMWKKEPSYIVGGNVT
jgi:hypothetical protein